MHMARITMLLAALTLATTACKPAHPSGDSAVSTTERRYVVRGVVMAAVPTGPSSPTEARHLMLKHEPIDDFVDDTGHAVGMNSMTMPFDVAPGVDLSSIHSGDAVRFTLAVDWAKPRVDIISVQKLPPGTALTFGPAHPPAAR